MAARGKHCCKMQPSTLQQVGKQLPSNHLLGGTFPFWEVRIASRGDSENVIWHRLPVDASVTELEGPLCHSTIRQRQMKKPGTRPGLSVYKSNRLLFFFHFLAALRLGRRDDLR